MQDTNNKVVYSEESMAEFGKLIETIEEERDRMVSLYCYLVCWMYVS